MRERAQYLCYHAHKNFLKFGASYNQKLRPKLKHNCSFNRENIIVVGEVDKT